MSVYDVFSAVRRVTKIGLRRRVLRTLTGTEELRDGDRNQNGNDQHDHHQLNEGETFLGVTTPRR